jgi:hypothetical protein
MSFSHAGLHNRKLSKHRAGRTLQRNQQHETDD